MTFIDKSFSVEWKLLSDVVFTESWSWFPAIITTTVSKEQTQNVWSAFDCWVFLMTWFCWVMLWKFWRKSMNYKMKSQDLLSLISLSLWIFVFLSLATLEKFFIILLFTIKIIAYTSIKLFGLVLLLKILLYVNHKIPISDVWFVIHTEHRWVRVICI